MIPCSFTWGDNWAPRIGATYDPTGDGRAKIYANWGRFFARIPNDLAVRMMSADALITRADYADAALTQPIPDGVLAGGETLHFTESGLRAGRSTRTRGRRSRTRWWPASKWRCCRR